VPSQPHRQNQNENGASSVPQSHFCLPSALEALQRWLFTTGGESEDMETFLTGYVECVRDLGLVLGRMNVEAVLVQPNESSYVWKWESGVPFESCHKPHQEFKEKRTIHRESAPFNVLMDTSASHIRFCASAIVVPHALNWMKKLGYEDYFALPIKHKGKFKGAVAWCTKRKGGFDADHIQFLEQSMQCLSTVLRTHTSDIVMSHLVGRLQDEVDSRTEELAKANQDLARANRHVINQSQAQLRHFAMMAHEIRTPLNGILGLASLLDQTPLNEEQKDIVQTISSSGDLLQRVVDDVLDYSKLAAGRVEIDMQVSDLPAILQPVHKSMSIRAKQHNITLRSTLAPDLPEKLYCDGRRMQQILYNLLGNAIKFSNPGGIVEFAIKAIDTPQGRRLWVKVKDYGKGIARQHLGRLFQPFLQAHGERNQLYGGTGLGLAITSKLVQALGGTIKVDSELARWTEFNVDLPCQSGPPDSNPESGHHMIKCLKPILLSQRSDESSAQSECASLKRPAIGDDADTRDIEPSNKRMKLVEEETMQPAEAAAAVKSQAASVKQIEQFCPSRTQAACSGLEIVRVLCAEDNLVNQKLITRVLKKIGVKEVDLVDNGSKAVVKTREKDYDLILMDMQMPIMDGLQATRLIKKHKNASGASPRVVFVSAHALKEIKYEAMESGADGFIAKPYNFGQIQDVVAQVAEQLKKGC